MDENLPEQTTKNGILEAYPDNWAYLENELARLDLIIQLQLLQKPEDWQSESFFDQFKGLVITKKEIENLLADDGRKFSQDNIDSPEVADVKFLKEGIINFTKRIQERRKASLKENVFLCLPYLSGLFQLTVFEENCLIACLAPELDRKYEKLYAYLQDDITRKKPAVDLLLELFGGPKEETIALRLAFEAGAPLRKFRLLHLFSDTSDGSMTLLSSFLKLDERIVTYLLGFRLIDARLESITQLITPHPDRTSEFIAEDLKNRIKDFIHSLCESHSRKENVIFYLWGPYGSGKRQLAEWVSAELEVPLLVADAAKMRDGQISFVDSVWLICREAVLQPAVICFDNLDELLFDHEKNYSELSCLFEGIRTYTGISFLIGSRPWYPKNLVKDSIFIDIEFSVPDIGARIQLWEYLKDAYQFVSDIDWGTLAGKFRFTPGQIRDALETARNLAYWRSPKDGRITTADLYAACRNRSSEKLEALATKIKAKYSWDDIALPPDPKEQLQEISNRIKYRYVVYGEWGFEQKFSTGKGLNILFHGSPGTGKTMAAEVIAKEACQDIYKIDLSQVVSKYIGETEKNLEQIFREARINQVILFFDEADALFGKRSEIKDAHDRYANVEIAYLLQKLDEHDGIVILATNLRQHLDEAFVRRIHAMVEFPFPDEEYRRRIWEMVFPAEAPLGADIDFGLLAREVRLAGGNIKNIALTAAFNAATDGGVIRMSHLLQAARREYQKLGRTWAEIQENY